MSEPTSAFKHFLYITAEPGTGAASVYLQAMQSLCWRQTALVRWSVAGFDVGEPAVRGADLIVIEWDEESAQCEGAFKSIRQWDRAPAAGEAATLRPILILRAASDRPLVEDEFLRDHPGTAVLNPRLAGDQHGLNRAFHALGFDLPIRQILGSAVGVTAPAIQKIIQDVGFSQFDLVLQKYFPWESKPKLFPVEGGWSGDPLVRVHARGEDEKRKEFFLKLFSRSEKFTNEIQNHERAYKWLKKKGAGIALHRIPRLGASAAEQLAAFPSVGPSPAPVFPVCYVSASADTAHKTFKDLFFESEEPGDVGKAFQRILAVLDAGNASQFLPDQPPFVEAEEEGPVVLSYKWRAAILSSIGELDRYGPAAFGEKWDSFRDKLKLFAHETLSGKLVEPRDVAVGPIHGDPNPRNCLVNPDDPEHVLMIDCGDYKPHGRLVCDLALIERDIKLVLMGNEEHLDGFYELDPRHLPDWCNAEKASIERGLDYSATDVAAFETICPSAFAAHSLVPAIRKQARAIRGADDPEGRHYFAALLYWMIRALNERAIPPTKKLLALYSMAQILRFFF